MATKVSAASQRKRSAKAAARKPRGKPFTPGNRYAWKPGESGNPTGQQGPKISDLLRDALRQKMPADARQALADLVAADATVGQIIGLAVALKAAGGDLEAVGVIADRTEGAPEQSIHVFEATGDDLARARAKAQAWEAEHAAETPTAPPPAPVEGVFLAPAAPSPLTISE